MDGWHLSVLRQANTVEGIQAAKGREGLGRNRVTDRKEVLV